MADANGPKAPEGKIYVCCACGKTSKELYGGPTAMRFWDESCMLNAVLANEADIVRGDGQRVTAINGEVERP
jgi:hypothetical protein